MKQNPGRLTARGFPFRERLSRLQAARLGVAVDISHSNEKTSLDILSASAKPVLVTHGGCAAVYDHPRHKSDDVLRALAKTASGPEIGAFYATALPLNAIAGHAGLPQVTLPVVCIEGCPLGLSIVGPRGADRALLKLAESLMGDVRRG